MFHLRGIGPAKTPCVSTIWNQFTSSYPRLKKVLKYLPISLYQPWMQNNNKKFTMKLCEMMSETIIAFETTHYHDTSLHLLKRPQGLIWNRFLFLVSSFQNLAIFTQLFSLFFQTQPKKEIRKKERKVNSTYQLATAQIHIHQQQLPQNYLRLLLLHSFSSSKNQQSLYSASSQIWSPFAFAQLQQSLTALGSIYYLLKTTLEKHL